MLRFILSATSSLIFSAKSVTRGKKESVKRKMILVRHGTLEVRYADINFFPLILFLYLRYGLRRKGGAARCLFLLKPDWKVCATCVVFVTITRSSYLWHKHHHGINLFIIRTVLHCFPAESNVIPLSNVFTNMHSSGLANLDKRIYENLIVNLLVLYLKCT